MIHVPAAEIEAVVETTAMLSKKSAANYTTFQVDLNLIKESIAGSSSLLRFETDLPYK